MYNGVKYEDSYPIILAQKLITVVLGDYGADVRAFSAVVFEKVQKLKPSVDTIPYYKPEAFG